MLKRPSDDTHPCDGSGRAPKKNRKEGQIATDGAEEEDVTSDETWSPSEDEMADDESGGEGENTDAEPKPPQIQVTRVLRSRGPVARPGDEMHPIMDKIDEVIDNESDFSSTTDEEEEEDEESDEDDGEEEEEDESDTEEDGYSDDDSFVTSCDEDEAEEADADEFEEEPKQTTHDEDASEPNPEIAEGPVTTDELLANFNDTPDPSLPVE